MKLRIPIKIESEQVIDVSGGVLKTIKYLPEWDYTIVVEEWHTRNLEQNAKYWAIVWAIMDDTWEDDETIHNFFKKMFLSKKVESEIFGVQEITPSTAKLSKKKFAEFLEKVIQRCHENWYRTETNDFIPSNNTYNG